MLAPPVGSQPLSRWDCGPLLVPYRPGTPMYRLQDKEQGMHPRATTCPTASDSASLPRWAPALPRALRLRTPPPCRDGHWCYHVSSGFGPRLLIEVGSGATMCLEAPDLASLLRRALTLPRVLRLQTHLPTGKGSSAATRTVVPNESWASCIKKGIAGLPIQLGSHVSKACLCVSKAPDTRAIMV
jgi:hypothetical protein